MRPAFVTRLFAPKFPAHVPAIALCLALAFMFAVGPVAYAKTAPFVVALPNGYYIKRDKSSEPIIATRAGKVVVQGPVAAYAVFRQLVAGAVGEWAPRAGGYPNATPYEGTPESRYFILDTTTGKLETGLDEATWRSRLDGFQVPKTFEITAPLLPE